MRSLLSLRQISWLVLVCMAAVLALSCQDNEIKEVNTVGHQKVIPVEKSTGVSMEYTDSGRVKARLTATEMERVQDEKNPELRMKKGLQILFYDTALQVVSTLRAERGIRFLNTGKTIFTQDVQVVSKDNDTLNTEELVWDQEGEKVTSDKFVRVKTPSEIIYSEGFESNLTFTEYKFFKIKGRVPVNP